MTKTTRLIRPRIVTGDGDGLVSHAGLVWLAETADLSGLTSGLTSAMSRLARRRHDPGRTLAQMIVALADGATCLSDLAALRDQPAMFGPVASEATVFRTFDQVGPAELRGITAARTAARERAWAAGAGPAADDDVCIDLDATLVTTKSDKVDAAPTYKRTYGHHPLLAMVTDGEEVLAGMLRPGNAGANNASDHVVVLGAAIDALPPVWRAGHHRFDDPGLVERTLTVRADAGGSSHWLAEECRHRNLNFSIGYPIDERVRNALVCCDDDLWVPAVDANGKVRDGAQVTELTDLVDLDAWPEGTRLVVRRERPHPGAQLSLFDTLEGMRHTAFITDTDGSDIAGLECRHRQRARAENIIRDTKACGLANLPFDCVVNNDVWMQLCFAANDLMSWSKRIGLTGQLQRATPKTIRHRLLHIAARITPNSQRLHLDHTWPWTTTLTAAINRIRERFRLLNVTTPPTPQAAL